MKILRLAQKLNAQHISLEWCRNMCNYVTAEENIIYLTKVDERGEIKMSYYAPDDFWEWAKRLFGLGK